VASACATGIRTTSALVATRHESKNTFWVEDLAQTDDGFRPELQMGRPLRGFRKYYKQCNIVP